MNNGIFLLSLVLSCYFIVVCFTYSNICSYNIITEAKQAEAEAEKEEDNEDENGDDEDEDGNNKRISTINQSAIDKWGIGGINRPDKKGKAALHHACIKGNIVRFL